MAGSPGEEHLDGVAAVQESGNFDQSGCLHGKIGEPVVDVVKHASRGIDLGRNFTNHGSHEEDSQSGVQEDLVDGNGHSENQNAVIIGMGAQVFDENKGQNHELTTHQITIEGLAIVDDFHNLVGSGMGFLVEMHIDRRETNKRCLSSFNHGEPVECNPKDKECGPCTGGGKLGVVLKDHCKHDNRAEKQQASGINFFKPHKEPLLWASSVSVFRQHDVFKLTILILVSRIKKKKCRKISNFYFVR